jgi:hypothetical protein
MTGGAMIRGAWALPVALLAVLAVPAAVARGRPPQILVGTWQGRADVREEGEVLAGDGRWVDRRLELRRTSD